MIKLSIIIVSWNTKELLRKCLESVDRCLRLGDSESTKSTITHHPSPITELIVVDNGSEDGSVEMVGEFRIKNKELRTKLIKNKENLGFAKGNNVGIKAARGEYIMLLNSDTIVKQDAIKKLVDFLDNHPEVDIVGPKLLNSDNTPQANCGRFPNLLVSAVMLFKEHFGGSNFVRCSPAKSCFVDWLMGAAFVARKRVYDKIGGLDKELFMYMEEVEWFYRVYKAGFKTYFLKEAEIIHLGRGSSRSGKTEPILNIYKGLIYFYKKHKTLPELYLLKMILKTKALLAWFLGIIKNDSYLKNTYAQAFKMS